MDTPGNSPRMLKACDACKARKVGCSGGPDACTRCLDRKIACHYSRKRHPRRRNVATQLLPSHEPTPSPKGPSPVTPPLDTIPSLLYVDQLLCSAQGSENVGDDRQFGFKGNGLFGGNYNLSFFSDSRLASLSARLKNNKINNLVNRISTVINGRVRPADAVLTGSLSRRKENLEAFEDRQQASKWITLYFQKVHPIFPFLNRQSFEAAASSQELSTVLKRDKAWSALYHAVLALGCQYDGGGSFEPGKGESWRLFATSLALFPDLLTLPNTLNLVQATAAMAIYASSISCIAIEHAIVSEGARRAQSLGYSSLTGEAQNAYQKTFWILYSMEKVASFYFGRTSVFVDHDIACPVPSVPDARYGDFDWFLSSARHARLLSKALGSVFSVGVRGSSGEYYHGKLERLMAELEQWRLSIPLNLRPGDTFRKEVLHQPEMQPVILWTHYLYHSTRLVFSRAILQLTLNYPDVVSPSRQTELKTDIMTTSWSILELTTFIEVEPQTPLWVIAGVPIIALFVLFDLVVHSPGHPETENNLALLDMVAGHFSRLQYASGGSLPGSLLTEFAYIAREYVNNVRLDRDKNPAPDSEPVPETVWADKVNLEAAETDTQAQDRERMALSSPMDGASMQATSMQSMGMDALPLTTTSGNLYDPNGDLFTGTDVMNLFNYFIPGIDPIFWPGSASAEMYPDQQSS